MKDVLVKIFAIIIFLTFVIPIALQTIYNWFRLLNRNRHYYEYKIKRLKLSIDEMSKI
ncbi:MAG TPA: hypothetical protein VM012_09295 [Flavitalea sp.]|nr:hypothetical protein [Flavitalea sp.]